MTGTPEQHEKDQTTIWTPREAAVSQQVAQYSRFVSAMKVALPVAAGILLLLVVVLPQFRNEDERFRIDMDPTKDAGSDTLSMTNARYFGTDDEGQPFSVIANGVRQHAKEDRRVDLVGPKAEIKLSNGTELSATASQGLYSLDQEQLDLSGEVTVSHNKENHLRTSSAVVMLKEGKASGREPVSSEGPFGTMQASGGFDLTERGKLVQFHGQGKLTLNPNSKAPPKPQPAVNPGAKP